MGRWVDVDPNWDKVIFSSAFASKASITSFFSFTHKDENTKFGRGHQLFFLLSLFLSIPSSIQIKNDNTYSLIS